MFEFMYLLSDVTPTAIDPTIWELVQQNYALVGTAVAGVVGSVGGLALTIKGGLKGVGELLGKKKEEGDATKNTIIEKAENLKTLTIRKGQLEVNKKVCETNIINYTIKLDVINKPESKELIENQIAMEKAELASITKELEEVDKQLPSLIKLL